jgi:hypothetical protein
VRAWLNTAVMSLVTFMPPTAPRMILGSHLQRFREAAGVTPDAAG